MIFRLICAGVSIYMIADLYMVFSEIFLSGVGLDPLELPYVIVKAIMALLFGYGALKG